MAKEEKTCKFCKKPMKLYGKVWICDHCADLGEKFLEDMKKGK